MNGGDSNTDMLLVRRDDSGYVPLQTLPVPGGEDAEFFRIDMTCSLQLPASVAEVAPTSSMSTR